MISGGNEREYWPKMASAQMNILDFPRMNQNSNFIGKTSCDL